VRLGDPVGPGVVASLARPDGNVTGLSGFETELHGKRLELLKEGVPKIARVAVLLNPATDAASLREFEPMAKGLGVQLQLLEAQTPSDLDNAFSAMPKGVSMLSPSGPPRCFLPIGKRSWTLPQKVV
jgi:putative tryptophan/tyrosine transport system substrate-binding protein